jgi:hypothetical protein
MHDVRTYIIVDAKTLLICKVLGAVQIDGDLDAGDIDI